MERVSHYDLARGMSNSELFEKALEETEDAGYERGYASGSDSNTCRCCIGSSWADAYVDELRRRLEDWLKS